MSLYQTVPPDLVPPDIYLLERKNLAPKQIFALP